MDKGASEPLTDEQPCVVCNLRPIAESSTQAVIGLRACAECFGAFLDREDDSEHYEAWLARVVRSSEHAAQAERVRELEGELSIAHRWILQRAEGHKDHACGECVPGGPMVDTGFACAVHKAREALRSKEKANG